MGGYINAKEPVLSLTADLVKPARREKCGSPGKSVRDGPVGRDSAPAPRVFAAGQIPPSRFPPGKSLPPLFPYLNRVSGRVGRFPGSAVWRSSPTPLLCCSGPCNAGWRQLLAVSIRRPGGRAAGCLRLPREDWVCPVSAMPRLVKVRSLANLRPTRPRNRLIHALAFLAHTAGRSLADVCAGTSFPGLRTHREGPCNLFVVLYCLLFIGNELHHALPGGR
jgi:hypothetical protein